MKQNELEEVVRKVVNKAVIERQQGHTPMKLLLGVLVGIVLVGIVFFVYG